MSSFSHQTLTVHVGHRDRALACFEQAVSLLGQTAALCRAAAPDHRVPVGSFMLAAEDAQGACDGPALIETFRAALDRACWRYVLRMAWLDVALEHEQLRALNEALRADTLPFNTPTCQATLDAPLAARDARFAQLIVQAFGVFARCGHDGRYAVPRRVVIARALSWRGLDLGLRARIQSMASILAWTAQERQWEASAGEALAAAVMEERPGLLETPYMRFTWYLKGTLHIEFMDDELREAVNETLARELATDVGGAAMRARTGQ